VGGRNHGDMKRQAHPSVATFTLALTMLASSACGQDATIESGETAIDEDINETASTQLIEQSELDAMTAQPDLVLELEGGSKLAFLIDEDGIGILEEVPPSAGIASVLDHPMLRDASPAVIWYALTKAGVEIPEVLRVHHEGLAAIGELPPLDESLAGHVRGLAPVPLADETSPCLNSTFNTNHCDHSDYDDAVCIFNTDGHWAWNVSRADRYKAGFCLQEGEAQSWLAYWAGSGSVDGECLYFRTDVFVWGASSYWNGTRYTAGTYRNYVWWRASNGSQRFFFHQANGDAGSVYDWGTRYSQEPCE